MMIHRFVSSLLLATMILTAAPLSVAAFNPFGGACREGNSNESVACKTQNGNQDDIADRGPKALLLNITTVVAYIAGAIAVIMIIVGSIQYITAGSDISTGARTDTDVEDARRTIIGALVGLAAIALARTLIFYVVDKF